MLAALFDLAGQLIMRVLPLVVLFDLASGLSRLWLFFGFGTAAIGIGVAGAVTWHSATDPNGQQSKLDLATNAFLFWPHNFFFAVTYFVGANKDDYQSAQKALQHGQAAVSAVPQLSLPRPPGAWVRVRVRVRVAHCPGLLGWTRPAPGCAPHSREAPQPLGHQWQRMALPAALAKGADVSAFGRAGAHRFARPQTQRGPRCLHGVLLRLRLLGRAEAEVRLHRGGRWLRSHGAGTVRADPYPQI